MMKQQNEMKKDSLHLGKQIENENSTTIIEQKYLLEIAGNRIDTSENLYQQRGKQLDRSQ